MNLADRGGSVNVVQYECSNAPSAQAIRVDGYSVIADVKPRAIR